MGALYWRKKDLFVEPNLVALNLEPSTALRLNVRFASSTDVAFIKNKQAGDVQ